MLQKNFVIELFFVSAEKLIIDICYNKNLVFSSLLVIDFAEPLC